MGGEGPAAWASRAAIKLEAALERYGMDVAGLVCADFGCHAGGFTDCLLRRGAATVYAVDTAYGVLEYRALNRCPTSARPVPRANRPIAVAAASPAGMPLPCGRTK